MRCTKTSFWIGSKRDGSLLLTIPSHRRQCIRMLDRLGLLLWPTRRGWSMMKFLRGKATEFVSLFPKRPANCLGSQSPPVVTKFLSQLSSGLAYAPFLCLFLFASAVKVFGCPHELLTRKTRVGTVGDVRRSVLVTWVFSGSDT
jgi:hypothetical protein